MVERPEEERGEDVQERTEPDQPPVDGPGGGTPGEREDDRDLSDTSQGSPGNSG